MVSAETGRTLAGVSSGLAGSLGGWLLSEHNGFPIALILLLLAGSVAFGLISTTERERDETVRKRQRRVSLFNFGALWIASCTATFTFNMTLPTAAMVGLGFGLMGNAALEQVEGKSLIGDLLGKLARWYLERGAK